MTDSNGDKGLEFPINQELLEEATHSREEWRIVKDRLTKIDASRGEVSAVVYERVHKDYTARLEEATSKVLKQKAAVDHELETLYETRKQIEAQLLDHKHKLEEIKFRNSLGEFTEEQYQSEARTEQDKIAKFETVLSAVDNNIGRYEAIFAQDEEIAAMQPPKKSKKHDPGATSPSIKIHHAQHEAEPATDSHGFVVEEESGDEDYFGTPPETEVTNPEIEESATSRSPADLGVPKKSHDKRKARVVIIGGDSAGSAYPIKGTITIGRADANTIVLKDAKISRQHAQIKQQGDEYVMVDLNSSNGTYVNGQRIDEHVLSNGDEIHVGDHVLQFQS